MGLRQGSGAVVARMELGGQRRGVVGAASEAAGRSVQGWRGMRLGTGAANGSASEEKLFVTRTRVPEPAYAYATHQPHGTGASAYTRHYDYARMRAIADKVRESCELGLERGACIRSHVPPSTGPEGSTTKYLQLRCLGSNCILVIAYVVPGRPT